MVELARRIRMRVPAAAGAAILLAAVALAGCGGSGTSRSTTSTPATRSTSTAPPASHTGSLGLSPAQPTTQSEITFTFTAPVASGVHGRHEISYGLSLVGPAGTGCVAAHETGSPPVARGAQGLITLGPAELQAPWCAGRYSARLLELASAHCTGSTPCPQYVRVVGLIGSATFTVRPS